MNIRSKIQNICICTGIINGVYLPVSAQGLDHSLGPIKQAQAADPAGFGLMVFCIGLLIFMVLALFIGTMFYFMKGQKKPAQNESSPPVKEATASTE